jgi:hypothetical protein
MKTFLRIAAVVLLLFALASCHRSYTSGNFINATAHHKVIAVLPAQVILAGRQPAKLTEADIAKVEEVESSLFQQALYNNILRHANSKKYYTNIRMQSLENTRGLLQDHAIDFRQIASTSDKELCKILKVDAVVRLNVQKNRYMSGLASFGLDFLNDILFNQVGVFIPGTTVGVPRAPSKTDDIITNCSIQSDGNTLWNDNYTVAADWRQPANEMVENITNKFGLHFPYRQRK